MGTVRQTLTPTDNPASTGPLELPLAPPAWEDDAAAWDTVRTIALHRLDQMMRFEPKVLRGEKPRAIHDFRVASRRLQQAFDLLCPDNPSHDLLRLRHHVSRSRKALSAARNYDVFIRRANRKLAAKRPSKKETWEAIRDYLVKRRTKAHARAAAKIGKLNLSQVYLRMQAAIEADAALNTSDHSPSLGKGSFRQKLLQELERAWNAFESASNKARGASDAAMLHPLRIAAKQLRYLIEIIQEFETRRSGRALQILRNLQDRLGEWHDLEVDERILAKMAGRPRFVRRHLDLTRSLLRQIAQNRKSTARLIARSMFDDAASDEIKTCVVSLIQML
ncbi:MAG TPA: CHAD domain-containing protein [Terriglobia bacterium]|nr:CHAD domain-containing protein [Terriglobia bacterium]